MTARVYTKSGKATKTTHIVNETTGRTFCGKEIGDRWVDADRPEQFEDICEGCIDAEIAHDEDNKQGLFETSGNHDRTVPPEAYRGGEAHPEDVIEGDDLSGEVELEGMLWGDVEPGSEMTDDEVQEFLWGKGGENVEPEVEIEGEWGSEEEVEFDPNAGFGYTMGEDEKPKSAFEAAAGEVLDVEVGEPLNDAMLADADDYAKQAEDFSFEGEDEEPISVGPTDPGYDEVYLGSPQPTTTPLDQAIAFRNLVIDASVLSFKPASMAVLRAKIAAFQALFDREPKIFVEGAWSRYWDIKRNKFVESAMGGMLQVSKVKTKWVTAHIDGADWDMDLDAEGVEGVYLV